LVIAVEVHASSATAAAMRFDVLLEGTAVGPPSGSRSVTASRTRSRGAVAAETPSATASPRPVVTTVIRRIDRLAANWKWLANGEDLSRVRIHPLASGVPASVCVGAPALRLCGRLLPSTPPPPPLVT
jgi:hypothetical protein